jgi:hypothetical protein
MAMPQRFLRGRGIQSPRASLTEASGTFAGHITRKHTNTTVFAHLDWIPDLYECKHTRTGTCRMEPVVGIANANMTAAGV